MTGLATIKSLLSQFNTSLQHARQQLEEGSPLPYEQNDDLSDGGASVGGDSGAAPKKHGRDKNYTDEVIEITPEMYGLTETEEPGKEDLDNVLQILNYLMPVFILSNFDVLLLFGSLFSSYRRRQRELQSHPTALPNGR